MEDLYLNPRPRKKYERKAPVKPVYQFDLEGNLIYMHKSMDVAVENLMINKWAIKGAIGRKGCYDQKWYFSHERKFVVPVKKTNQNPLLSKMPGKIGLSPLPELILPEDLSEEDW